jgi:DDE superfamily endonuclease
LAAPEAGEKIVFFDECWFADRPTIFYGWARVNTRCRVPSYEKNRTVRYGLLAVDAQTGEEHIDFAQKLNAETVATYFTQLAHDAKQAGYTLLTVIIDNNSIHKDKMRYDLWLRVREHDQFDEFRIRFIDTPRYSPELNLAEYIIHQLRLRLFHHMPSRSKMDELCETIQTSLKKKQLQTKEQIQATIQHILKLAGVDADCVI